MTEQQPITNDLAQVTYKDSVIEIKHPATDEPIGVRVKLMSINDPRMNKLRRRITDTRLDLEKRGKGFKADDIEENKFNILFATMISWEWYNPTGEKGDNGYNEAAMPSWAGTVPEFERRQVIAVLQALPWFTDQINEAIGDTKAFF